MTAVLEQEAHVVAQQRAAAHRAMSSTPFQQVRGRAAEAVFAWVAGEAGAPLSGAELTADADGLFREWSRGREREERLGFRGDDAQFAGTVALVIDWLTRPDRQAPFLF